MFSQQDYEGSEVDENGKSEEMLYDGLSIQQPVTIGNSDFLFALSASDWIDKLNMLFISLGFYIVPFWYKSIG